MKYPTRRERFEAGDYPMICVLTGRPADALLPVMAKKTAVWPFLLLPVNLVAFLLASVLPGRGPIAGLLPFATDDTQDSAALAELTKSASVTYERAIGVIIGNAHPEFVNATRVAQGRGPA